MRVRMSLKFKGGGGGGGGRHCNSKCYASSYRVQSGMHEYDKAGVHDLPEWSRLIMGDARPLPGAANH